MSDKKIVLVLNASSEYIKHTGEDAKRYISVMNRFFEAMNETYLPLLDMFERLESGNVPFKVALVLSPAVCALLDDSEIQGQYKEWIERRIEFGKRELEKYSGSPELAENIAGCLEKNEKSKSLYEKYKGKILRKFLDFHKRGFVELMATCGTDIFLPHYNDMPEVINAQIETGLFAYKAFFGETPEGFWLPELGYYPETEKYIRSFKFNYTVLDSRSFLFSDNEPEKGIFSPARFENSLAVFSKYDKADDEIFGDDGYSGKEVYLATNRDAAFDAEPENVLPFIEKGEPRYSFGYKYWSKTQNKNVPYSFSDAKNEAAKDADDFLSKKLSLFQEAEKCLKDEPELSLAVAVDLNELRKKWAEGLLFIENLFTGCEKYGISFEIPKTFMNRQYKLQKIHPCYGSSSALGYGEEFLSSKNSWMMRYARKASERMVDLSERFPGDTGLKARLLNLGAKELVLAQSSGWAKMIENDEEPEYAEIRFKQHINDFTAVFDALGSKTVSTEWLTKLENEHQIFQWMNYKIYGRRK